VYWNVSPAAFAQVAVTDPSARSDWLVRVRPGVTVVAPTKAGAAALAAATHPARIIGVARPTARNLLSASL
jgi:hypothetical protein